MSEIEKYPLISVIIPVYNAEKYVADCVQSILNQTYKNLEVLIVDDGSTDTSALICDQFTDARVKVFHNHNMGLSYSRQFGIDNSNGEFFVTIDADDFVLPDFISLLYKSICDNESDVAVCNRFDFFKHKKRIVNHKSSANVTKVTNESLKNSYYELASKLGLSDSWDKMYKTSFVRNSNVKFSLPKNMNGNDLLFNYKLLLHCPVYSIVNEPLLMHRLTKNSMVRSSNRPMVAGFKFIIEDLKNESFLCGFSDELDIELSKTFLLFVRLIFLYYCGFSKKYMSDVKKAFFELREYILNSDFLKLIDSYSTLDYNHDIDESFVSGNFKKMTRVLKKYRFRIMIKKVLKL